MPNPGASEKRPEFVSRCIRETIDDGTTKDPKQAAAICYSKWRNRNKKEIEAVLKSTDPLECFYALTDFGILVDDEIKGAESIADEDKEFEATLFAKAVWTRAYINNLPDSAFLYVEPGGEKDSEGKTKPRTKRHFPYKDASGKVDRAHVTNAIARIPQSNAPGLSPAKKTSLQNRARKILSGIKGFDIEDMENKEYVPYGVMTFNSLDEYRKGQEMLENTVELAGDYIGLFQRNVTALMDGVNGLGDFTPAQFESNIKALTSEFISRLNNPPSEDKGRNIIQKALDAIRGKGKPEPTSLMVYKDTETGEYRWIARYSNKFRDDDNPPEIISEASHKRFVDYVDKGLVPYPELWLWHEPEWVIGKSTWVSYDDAGFAMAAGYFYDYAIPLAEAMARVKSIGVSHGMPTDSIKRDKDDPTIIVEHYTKEISPLPPEFAANKLAEVVAVLLPPEEEKTMSIPETKKAILGSEWGVGSDVLNAIESKNKGDAEKAITEGIEFKEKAEGEAEVKDEASTEEVASEVEQETSETEQTQEAEQTQEDQAEPEAETEQAEPEAEKGLDLKAVVETLSVIGETMKSMSDRQATLEKDNQEIRKALDNILAQSPRASLGAMLFQNSAIGNPDAAVDGRSTLAKDKPAEADAQPEQSTGVPLLDSLLHFEARKPQES